MKIFLKKYFISYNFVSDAGNGFGNIILQLEDKIADYEYIEEIQSIIIDKYFKNQNAKVVVLNFIKL